MAPQYSGADHHLHFVMIPLMCPGHIIPMADMARLLAQRGVIISIITTTLNAIRIKPIIGRAIESGLPIRLVQLRLQLHEVGLPEGCESIDAIPSRGLFGNFFSAVNKLQQPVEELLEDMDPSPSCILADKNLPWTSEVAEKFNIPRLLFDGTSCFNLLCCHSLNASQAHMSASDSEPFVVPGLPDKIELTTAQLPSSFNPSMQDFKDLHAKIRASEEKAYGIVINSFEELESAYVKEYRKARGDNKVWCIGPVSLSNKTDMEKARRGNESSIDESKCLKWLDSWPENSVVYACFGSLCRLTPLQLIELGLGLEACNKPFLWVIRGDNNGKEELEKWISENGFEERTKGRGLLIRGWAPQVLILSHPAIGGFLTHCGWNSTLEAVCAGVPMVTWPLFADQFFNEKLVVQVLKIGERVGNEIAVPVGEGGGALVKREKVREAIQKIMAEGKEMEERRERVRKLAEMAREATEKGGSSFLSIALLIEEIRKLGVGIQS